MEFFAVIAFLLVAFLPFVGIVIKPKNDYELRTLARLAREDEAIEKRRK